MHFTHVDNLAGIMASGWVKADSLIQAEAVAIKECGNIEIKSRRRNKEVTVDPYGKVGDYVPFYYAARSPMLYSEHYSKPHVIEKKNNPRAASYASR